MSHNVSAGKTTDVAYSIGIFLIVYYCHLSPRKGDETHIYTPTSCSISPTLIAPARRRAQRRTPIFTARA
jgi:hypothetical protein